MASSTAAPPLLDNSIVRIAFQVYAFIEATGRSHLHEVPHETGVIIEYIHENYPRPEVTATSSRTSKQSSAEPSDFPPTWATDAATFRRSVRAFNDRTYTYRRLPQLVTYLRQHDPPSTGITPTRPLSPIGNPPAAAITLVTPTSTRATSATSAISAEEAIYDRPIGPEPRPPPMMDEETIRRIIAETVQATVAQSVQAALANAAAAPPAPPGGPAPPAGPAPLALMPTR